MADTWVHTDESELGEYEATSSYETYCFWGEFLASSSWTCDRLGIYSHADPENDPYVKLAIYDDNGSGQPGDLLAESSAFQITGSGWYDVTISDVSITSGNRYFIGHITSAAPTTQWRYRNPTPANGVSDYETPITYPTFPDPASSSGPSTRRYGAYRMGYASADIEISQTKQSVETKPLGGICQTSVSWLSDWAKRMIIRTPAYTTEENHTHLTMLIKISTSSGIDGQDLSWVFDEVGSNSKKIAFTLPNSTTQLYGVIIRWDSVGEEAWILVALSSHVIYGGCSNFIYMYADNTKADNTTYIDDPGGIVAQNICESSLKLFQLLHNNPADTPPEYKDMTSGNHDGSENGTLTRETNPNQGYVTDTDATSGNHISIADHADLDITQDLTVLILCKREGGLASWSTLIGKMATGDRVLYCVFDTSNYFQLRLNTENDGTEHYIISTTPCNDTTNFHLIGGTTKQSTGQGYCYRDGVQCGSLSHAYTVLSTNNDSLHLLNNEQWGEEFNGKVGAIMLFNSVKSDDWFQVMYRMFFDNFFKFGSMEEAQADVEINQVKKSIDVTPKTHKIAIDLLINQAKKTANATPKSHSVAIDEVVNQTKKSVQGTAKSHSLLIDEAISQAKQAIEAAAKTHGIAIDVLINQIKQAIQASPKSHAIAIDLLINQVKKSIDVTPKSHTVAIDEVVNQVKKSIEVAAKTHVILLDVAISQTKQSIDVTGKTHYPLIDVAISQTKQNVQVVPKSHSIAIDLLIPHTKQSVDVTGKSHSIAIDLLINQVKKSVQATGKSHSVLIDEAISQIKQRIEADPKTHTIQISEDVEINQTKQAVEITAKSHSLLIDEAITQIKQAIQADTKSHSVAIDLLINQIKETATVTPKTHGIAIDEIINQVAQSVNVTGKTHQVAIDEIITQTAAAIAATAKCHRVALSEIINQTRQSVEATPKSHTIVTTADIEIQQVLQHIIATGKSHSILIVGGFIIIIGKGLRTMDRKVIFNFDYPQQILPVVELNQNATAHGDIDLKVDDLEEITSIDKSIYSCNPPSSTSDNWQGVGADIYDSSILYVTYTRLSTGRYRLHYSFDPSGITGIGDGQFYAILIKVNAADNATIPQAGIEFIMKINNNIAIPG